jgi:hypothetical protein
MRKRLIISLILAVVLAGMICSDGIEYGRTIYDGKLSDSGHSWAGYKERCEGDNFILEFNLNNLTGGVQANLNLNDSNRYAIGFVNLENGSLATYLYREEKENVEHFPGMTIDYDPLATYQVQISSADGEVQVSIRDAKDGKALKVIDYLDADPLPAGAIDFETLENSSARMRNVVLNCEMPAGEEPPNLGVGYFKPPE